MSGSASDLPIKIGVEGLTQLESAFDKVEARLNTTAGALRQHEQSTTLAQRALEAGVITQDRYAQAIAASQAKLDAHHQAANRAAGGFGNLNQVIQQGGYQFGDLAVQIQGGQNALVAISQQGSQFLGMFGPAGAVAGVALTIGTIAANFLLTADNAEKAKDSSADAFKAMQAGAQTTAELIEKVNNQFRSTEEIAARVATKAHQAMRLQLSSQIDSYEPIRANLRQQLDEEGRFQRDYYESLDPRAERSTDTTRLQASQQRAHELANQLLEVEANARKAKDALNAMHRGVYGAEERGPTSADPNGAVALQASLDKRFAAQEAYAGRVRDIQAQLRDGWITESRAQELAVLAAKERDSAIESLTTKTRGLTDAQKAENAEITAMSQIIRDINRDYDKYQDDQMRAREREEDQRAREADAALKRQEAEIKRTTDDVVRYGSDLFADMFATTEGGWNRTWENMGRTARAMLARIAAEAVIRPVVMPLVGGLMGTTALSSTAGAGDASPSGLLNMASTGSSLWNSLGSGSLSSRLDLWGANALGFGSTANAALPATLGLSNATQLGAALPALPAAPAGLWNGGSALGGFSSFSNVLGIAGSALPGLMSGNYTQAGLGVGGAALGTAILPGPGTIIGGLAGNLLGGMFGNDPASPASSVQIGIGANGQLTIMGDRSKGMSSAEGLAAAQQTLAGLNTAVAGRGLSLRQSNGAVAQTHQGADARPEADRQEMTRVVLASLQGGSAEVSGIIARELAKGTAASLDKAFSDIDFAQQVYGPLTQAYRAVVPFGEALAAIAKPFDDAAIKARELGLAEGTLIQRRDEAISRAKTAATEGFWSATRSAEGRDYINNIIGIRQNWFDNGAQYDAIAGAGSGDLLYTR